MKSELKFYICKKCGNIVVKVKDSGVPVFCCGEEMEEIIPGEVEAATEKHLPVYEIEENEVNVKVGEIEHPMVEEHYIQWVAIQTNEGYQIKKLEYGNKPEVKFSIGKEEKVENVYAYCNLHGLWRA